MKKILCILCFLLSANLWAAGGSNGLGLVFGDPSGITFQHKFSEEQFADLYFAYSWDKEVIFIGDYKFHLPGLFQEKLPITPYVGIGAFFQIEDKKHNDDVALGVRVPLGIDWKFPNAPVVLFGELVPAMKLISSTDAEFQAGIGGRFYF